MVVAGPVEIAGACSGHNKGYNLSKWRFSFETTLPELFSIPIISVMRVLWKASALVVLHSLPFLSKGDGLFLLAKCFNGNQVDTIILLTIERGY